MAFIAKNPLSAAKLETSPPSPIEGARGLFAKEDGWYDINDNGDVKKIATGDSGVGKKTDEGGEIFNDYEGNKASAPYSHAEGLENNILSGLMYNTTPITYISYADNVLTLTDPNGFLDNNNIYGFRIKNKGSGSRIYVDLIKVVSSEKVDDNWLFTIESPIEELGLSTANEIEITPIIEGENIVEYAHAEGSGNYSIYKGTHTEGNGNLAAGSYAHVEGEGVVAKGRAGHAEGYNTKVTANYGHSEGAHTIAGYGAHAEGESTEATGGYAHSEGTQTKATAANAHAEGKLTVASAANAHAENEETHATASNTHAEGYKTEVSNRFSHGEGYNVKVSGEAAHGEGEQVDVSGRRSHGEGWLVNVSGNYSHGEGYSNTIKSDGTHVEGGGNNVEAAVSHVEGYNNTVNGSPRSSIGNIVVNHVEGYKNTTTETSYFSHVEGRENIMAGYHSHIEGYNNKILEGVHAAHVEGRGNNAYGGEVHIQGIFSENDSAKKYIHIVGNGTSDIKRSNAHTLDKNGNAWFSGDVTVGADNKKLATEEYIDNIISNNAIIMVDRSTKVKYEIYIDNGKLTMSEVSE